MITKTQKKEWLKALRSGEYSQGSFCLANNHGGFCCLGVLFDATKDGDWETIDGGSTWTPSSPDCHPSNGSPYSEYGYSLLGDSVMCKLMVMNDSGKSFSTIAKYIERWVPTK